MKLWKRNLFVCWVGCFITSISLSQIAPLLPIYIKNLGINNPAKIASYSGLAFGITYIISAIFSPIWGSAADKIGRKPMLLRASFGMAFVIGAMGYAKSVNILILLRLLQGTITGYITACTTLIATQTTKENAGAALGTLSTAGVAGSLFGPIVGGFIESNFGFKNVFLIIGSSLIIVFLTTLIFVKENFEKNEKSILKIKDVWKAIPQKSLTIISFFTYFIMSVGLYSVEPVITVYISELSGNIKNLSLISGLAFSISGLANIISAPKLGRLCDKIGVEKVMLVSLIISGLLFIPQALVKNISQFITLRFLLGLTMGGLVPAVNILVKKITPNSLTGRMFGINIAAGYLGVFSGSILGGQITAFAGVRWVFIMTGVLLLANAVLIYFKVYKKGGIYESKDYSAKDSVSCD